MKSAPLSVLFPDLQTFDFQTFRPLLFHCSFSAFQLLSFYPPMPLRRLAIVLIALLVLGEAAVAVWRHLPIEPSTAPVFTFPPAAENFGKSPALAPAIEM